MVHSLGERDSKDIKEHPFFAGVDWEALLGGRIRFVVVRIYTDALCEYLYSATI